MAPRASMINLSFYYIRSLVLVNSEKQGVTTVVLNYREFDIIYSFSPDGYYQILEKVLIYRTNILPNLI